MSFNVVSNSFKDGDYLSNNLIYLRISVMVAQAVTSRRI
jgi:hypothetical protein